MRSAEGAGLGKRSGAQRPGLATGAAACRFRPGERMITFLQGEPGKAHAGIGWRPMGPEQLGRGLKQINLRGVFALVDSQEGQNVIVS